MTEADDSEEFSDIEEALADVQERKNERANVVESGEIVKLVESERPGANFIVRYAHSDSQIGEWTIRIPAVWADDADAAILFEYFNTEPENGKEIVGETLPLIEDGESAVPDIQGMRKDAFPTTALEENRRTNKADYLPSSVIIAEHYHNDELTDTIVRWDRDRAKAEIVNIANIPDPNWKSDPERVNGMVAVDEERDTRITVEWKPVK